MLCVSPEKSYCRKEISEPVIKDAAIHYVQLTPALTVFKGLNDNCSLNKIHLTQILMLIPIYKNKTKKTSSIY